VFCIIAACWEPSESCPLERCLLTCDITCTRACATHGLFACFTQARLAATQTFHAGCCLVADRDLGQVRSKEGMRADTKRHLRRYFRRVDSSACHAVQGQHWTLHVSCLACVAHAAPRLYAAADGRPIVNSGRCMACTATYRVLYI
jgi:hypothetical protein